RGKRRDERHGGGNAAPQQPRRQPQPEVNEEDVQKQIKETLARLTGKGKGQAKGVKWRKEKREANANREREAAQHEAEESKVLKITEFVTVNDLASMMNVPVNSVIATCMNLGEMVSINQRLDAETINIVAEEFGFTTEYVSAEVAEAISQEEDREEDLQSRPPVVTVMGHVDHGKTSLLDYIRDANVIAGEAGGITQHIGAYNVRLEDGRQITFLDTPGHEAFTAMRARGAKMTDVCIIIVAADDNVMPQTVEAINHASAAGVPIVFAINKIDKPTANPEKIKEELAAMNYLVEDWGGKYQSQDISAKKGIGVNDLMEKVLLEAEMLDLKANPNRNATGSIIESSLDKGRGYVATVLVQNGTLRIGDIILAGKNFGKVKAMFNERNQRIREAGPGTPAVVLGLNGAPTAGDTFNVLDTEQEAREIANKREQLQREQGLRTKKILTLEDIGRRRAIGNFQELNIIVKGDVDGSIEALSDSLIKLSTESIQVNVLHKAVGEISESDVTLAAASDAIIIGFQVRPSQAARREAEREGVEIRLYSVIYQAIEEVKDAMEGMLAPEIKEEVIGSAEVLQTYHISKVGTIAGCIVREGKIKRGCKVRLIRDGIVKYTGELGSLKRMKDDVKEVLSGYDCGMSIAGYNDIHEGDFIEAFEEVEVKQKLD
ncbi:MAG: translation initiation factor IF-2, partial [Clostridium sp.]|nr:translation initiation factor IF-2 [Clostridium sp.]